MQITSHNHHISYPAVYRHWHAASEPLAGADCLMTALQDGWTARPTVYAEEYWHAGARQVTILHFELERDGEMIDMPVLGNPYARRFIWSNRFTVLPISERTQITRRSAAQS